MKKWQSNISVYWSDGLRGQAFDHHSRNGGRAFANQNCLQGQAFDQFFQILGGMVGAGIDSHILQVTDNSCKLTTVCNKLVRKNDLSVNQLCVHL